MQLQREKLMLVVLGCGDVDVGDVDCEGDGVRAG